MSPATLPLPRPPVVLDEAVGDPGLVRDLIDAHAPYWPVQRYFANSAEYAALSGQAEPAQMIIAPVFRGNWATDGEPLDGVQPILSSKRFPRPHSSCSTPRSSDRQPSTSTSPGSCRFRKARGTPTFPRFVASTVRSTRSRS